MKRLGLFILLSCVLLVLPTGAAGNPGGIPPVGGTSFAAPGVVPVVASPRGQSYGHWAADWWQWALEIPIPSNPILDTTGANCAVGQSGGVWFLAGSFGTTEERDCVVPQGKHIFFPIINALGYDGGRPESELRADAHALIDLASNLQATVDGTTIDVSAQRADSPLFQFTLPTDNVLGEDAGTYPGVADGYWVMLAPLSRGVHMIRFHAQADGFALDVTYNLTIGR